MNIYYYLIIFFIFGDYILNLIADYLNLKNWSPELPEEFKDYYDAQKYSKSQFYLKDTTNFSEIKSLLNNFVLLQFFLLGGFNYLDNLVRSFGSGELITGLLFLMILTLVKMISDIPFSYYGTFVIEEKYGFNKTTHKTFISDQIKQLLLTIILSVPILLIILFFFSATGKYSWLYIWIVITVIQFIIIYLAPVLIMPLFNKFVPLENEELKQQISNYAEKENFPVKGVYQTDGSKRSSKSNAYFTGIGRTKKIAIFDTLLEKCANNEILTVLAHEVGHFKLKHIRNRIVLSILQTGVMLFILSLFMENKDLFTAFQMEKTSVYASLIFFGLLFSPVSQIISLLVNIISRKDEYAADRFAVKTTQKPQDFTTALKKITVDSMSNLTPHPLYVALNYSHPPILNRIEEINKMNVNDPKTVNKTG